MKASVLSAESVIIAVMTLMLASAPSLSASCRADYDESREPPTEYITVWGIIYGPDGITPVTNCVVNVTNKNNGEWALTTTIEGGWYVLSTSVFNTYLYGGEVLNITANKEDMIGWNEGVAEWPYVTIDITMTVPRVEFELNLVRGWNLISIPLVNDNLNASNIGLEDLSVVVSWNPLKKTYDKTFIVGVSPPTADFYFSDSCGYWIYVAVDQTLVLTGQAPTGVQTRVVEVPAGGGWVDIGLKSLKTTWKASMIPSMFSGGSVVVVAMYDPITKTYKTYIPGFPPSDFYLIPGRGYEVYVTGSGIFSYVS